MNASQDQSSSDDSLVLENAHDISITSQNSSQYSKISDGANLSSLQEMIKDELGYPSLLRYFWNKRKKENQTSRRSAEACG